MHVHDGWVLRLANGPQVTFMTCCLLLTTVALTYVFTRSKPVYLLEYHCFKPDDRRAHPVCALHASALQSECSETTALELT
jgi:3-ketoacyl-CoA synthase